MMNNSLITLSILVLSVTIYEGAQLHGASIVNSSKNISRGICTVEVPTISLLSPEERYGVALEGNGSIRGYSKLEVCCPGWKRTHNSQYCEAVCNNCENGNCTAPGVCECKRGYIEDEYNNCLPTCPLGCLNGVCTDTGDCHCNTGNVLSKNGKYCNPHCTGGCGIGGTCLGPEYCICEKGFTLDPKTNKCGYHCEGGCDHGTCSGPNRCSCNEGYKMKGNTCIPECPKGCLNGQCVAPNRCSCNPGWILDKETESICTPQCHQPCINGNCVAPDNCVCKKGYIQIPETSGGEKCVEICPGGCVNGVCARPNFCVCNHGYVKKSKGSNECVNSKELYT